MKEQVISVTAAARMFADCVNRVRYQGVSFLLQKNGVSVARIVPVDRTSGLNLEDVVAKPTEAEPAPSGPAKNSSDVVGEPSPPKRSALNW